MTIRDLARGVWPFVLLLVFLGTFRRGEPGAAARDVALDSADTQRLIEIADGYLAQGRTDLAEAEYRRAISIDPRDGDVHVRLGELLLKRGDMKYALPFGTFLALGAAVAATVGPGVLNWYLGLW